MTDYQIDIPGHKLIIGDKTIPIPDGLMDSKAFTKNGAIEGRSHAGKALKGWVDEQMAPEASQKPADSDQGEVSNNLSPEPESPPVAPKTDFGPMPRLGSHEASARLVEIIASLWPDAKPSDWRAVQSMLQNAMRYGKQFGDMVRK